jgi:hypothetical protein
MSAAPLLAWTIILLFTCALILWCWGMMQLAWGAKHAVGKWFIRAGLSGLAASFVPLFITLAFTILAGGKPSHVDAQGRHFLKERGRLHEVSATTYHLLERLERARPTMEACAGVGALCLCIGVPLENRASGRRDNPPLQRTGE